MLFKKQTYKFFCNFANTMQNLTYFSCLSYILIGLFVASCEKVKQVFKQTPPKIKTLLLVPLGDVPATEVEEVRQTLLMYYKLTISVAPKTVFPAYTTNQAVAKEMKMNLPLRYRADSLLRFLNKEKRGTHDYVLGVANVDITCTNRYENGNGQIMFPAWMHADWGIFGLGYLGGKACIVSSFRLRFDNPDLPKLNSRLTKLARHEVGHNFGLNHCAAFCFMSAADLRNALVALDHESDSLCKKCQGKLGNLLKKNTPAKISVGNK
jgi:archaemetzincin